jgi:hypothetical protein
MSAGNLGFASGRNSGSFGNRSSNFRSAVNDGQWHSFGNAGGSARFSGGRTPGNFASSGFSSRNGARMDGGWHSFGASRAGNSSFAGSRVGRSTFGSFSNARFASNTRAFGGSRFNSFSGFQGFGNRGFGSGLGWRGNGWRGNGFGFGRPFYGWGGGFFGAGFGWGFGVGWPYWGPGWAFGWDPWLYNPYIYSPWPSYNYYQSYPDTGYNNAPSYDPNPSYDDASRADYSITPTMDPAALHFNINARVGD